LRFSKCTSARSLTWRISRSNFSSSYLRSGPLGNIMVMMVKEPCVNHVPTVQALFDFLQEMNPTNQELSLDDWWNWPGTSQPFLSPLLHYTPTQRTQPSSESAAL
jgi:hypothetical protein